MVMEEVTPNFVLDPPLVGPEVVWRRRWLWWLTLAGLEVVQRRGWICLEEATTWR
jgi:hypothetical protein